MPIQNNYLLKSSLGLFALGVLNSAFSQKSEKPDIVIIYADDLGYGDVSGLGPRGDAILEFDWSVGKIDPGTSDALISQVDFLSSFASLTGQTLPYDAAPDSFDQIQALLGKSKTGNDTVPQLYNIGNDLGEKMNIASENPFIVKELTDLLRKIKADGRTR